MIAPGPRTSPNVDKEYKQTAYRASEMWKSALLFHRVGVGAPGLRIALYISRTACRTASPPNFNISATIPVESGALPVLKRFKAASSSSWVNPGMHSPA
eukprot:6197008-Pyramimonas_sp.AAC.1